MFPITRNSQITGGRWKLYEYSSLKQGLLMQGPVAVVSLAAKCLFHERVTFTRYLATRDPSHVAFCIVKKIFVLLLRPPQETMKRGFDRRSSVLHIFSKHN